MKHRFTIAALICSLALSSQAQTKSNEIGISFGNSLLIGELHERPFQGFNAGVFISNSIFEILQLETEIYFGKHQAFGLTPSYLSTLTENYWYPAVLSEFGGLNLKIGLPIKLNDKLEIQVLAGLGAHSYSNSLNVYDSNGKPYNVDQSTFQNLTTQEQLNLLDNMYDDSFESNAIKDKPLFAISSDNWPVILTGIIEVKLGFHLNEKWKLAVGSKAQFTNTDYLDGIRNFDLDQQTIADILLSNQLHLSRKF